MPKFLSVLFIVLLSFSAFAQDVPTLMVKGEQPQYTPADAAVLYEQMANFGTNSLTSQNFEAANDGFDNQGADDFSVTTGFIWTIESVEVLGVYYNGVGPAASYNVFFYNTGALPGTLAAQALNATYTDPTGLGAAIITISPPIVLPEGSYWVSVQCNMDFSAGGQWGWTEQLQTGTESAWQNPGGGFGVGCTTWGYRVTNCAIGAAPYYDYSFRLNGTSIPVPVELTSFTATANENEVVLNWSTATETNNQGFSIERSSGSEFEAIGYVAGFGTTTESKYYSFTDGEVTSGTYTYRLKQIDFDGTFEYSNVVEVEVLAPAEFNLAQNYPNPFNPSTMIAFKLAVDSKVSLKIFNVLGQEVASLVNSNLVAGSHQVNFDASSLNTGVYMYRIEVAGIDGTNFVDVKKMILTK